jgi:hypothetical protein
MRNSSLKQIVLALICLIMLTGNISGQSKIIEVWNGKVPGSIQKPNYKQIVDSAYWIKIRFIANPTIQVYPAPADKNTGTAVVVCPGGGYYGI